MIDCAEFYRQRNDRQMRYAGRVLPPDKYINLQADYDYVSRYDGQVAIITAANILSRMTPSLALDIPEVKIVASLPWAGILLRDFVFENICHNDPHNHFVLRKARSSDFVLHIGRRGGPVNVHGSGWNAFVGNSPSPVITSPDPNPVGPAFASIIAATRLFRANLFAIRGDQSLNAYSWTQNIDGMREQPFVVEPDLGNIWFIGAGSVGSSAIYFLPFATCKFSPTVVDMDRVEEHNLDRSPIFTADDAKNKRYKASVVAKYLKRAGFHGVSVKTIAFHETDWSERESGAPDLLISAANEQNVRYYIESGYPPLQIYSTTGKNWQSTLFTHVPMQGECSCCVFSPESPTPAMQCAEGVVRNIDTGEQVDASLPFLSFAAGLMTVAEILKLGIPDYRISSRRVMFEMVDNLRIVSATRNPRDGCLCAGRSRNIHHQMLSRSRYEYLSNSDVSKPSVLE